MKNLHQFLKNHPLVVLSLLIGIIEAPITFYSGVFLGKGIYLIAALFFCMSTFLWVISTIIYYKLILKE